MIHNIKFSDGTIQTCDCKIGTGILDKNGNEIFEGDVVKVDGESGDYEVSIYDFFTKQLEEFDGGLQVEIIQHEDDL